MRTLTTVSGVFEARLIVARLGADGILCQLRGGMDGPYPIGLVEVLVEERSFDLACALLLADDVADAIGHVDHDEWMLDD